MVEHIKRMESLMKVANYSPLTIYAYTSDVKFFEDKPINDDTVLEFLNSLVNYKPSTRARKIASLKMLLHANNISVSVPMPKVKVKNNYRDYLDIPFSEFEKISFDSLRDKIIVFMLLYTGMRRGELENLTWDSVDLKRKILKIHGKGGKVRIVPLADKIIDDLLEWRSIVKNDPKFEGKRDRVMPYSYGTIWRVVKKYTGKYPHFLRSVFITNVSKIDPVAAKDLAGHSKIDTTMRYIRRSTDTIKRAFDMAIEEMSANNESYQR